MSKAFEEISAGLDDAVKHARGKSSKVVVHEPEPLDVKAIRQKTEKEIQALGEQGNRNLSTAVTHVVQSICRK